MSRPLGDECYICPSCGGGSRVIAPANVQTLPMSGIDRIYRMDVVGCTKCFVVFAVDDSTVPSAEEAERLYR